MGPLNDGKSMNTAQTLSHRLWPSFRFSAARGQLCKRRF